MRNDFRVKTRSSKVGGLMDCSIEDVFETVLATIVDDIRWRKDGEKFVNCFLKFKIAALRERMNISGEVM